MDEATLCALAQFPLQLEAHYAAIPPEFANWRPASWDGVPSEPLTAVEQICHVRDVEIDGYHVRVRRTLEESSPRLTSLDGEALAIERSYASADATAVFAAFRQAREKTLALVTPLTAEQLARTAHFDGHEVTLRSVVHYLCSHDQQHLAGIQWLLGKMASAPIALWA
jgi:hypothetical protein